MFNKIDLVEDKKFNEKTEKHLRKALDCDNFDKKIFIRTIIKIILRTN